MTLTKKDLIYLSIIGLMLAFYFGSEYRDSNKLKKNDTIIATSKGRNEVLKSELDSTLIQLEKANFRADSALAIAEKEPEVRIINKYIYEEIKANTLSLGVDSAIAYSARWLSKADTLR